MLFRKKGRLRRDTNKNLLILLEQLKQEWMKNKQLVEKSVEPSDELLHYVKVSEVKYFYLVREVRKRNISITGIK